MGMDRGTVEGVTNKVVCNDTDLVTVEELIATLSVLLEMLANATDTFVAVCLRSSLRCSRSQVVTEGARQQRSRLVIIYSHVHVSFTVYDPSVGHVVMHVFAFWSTKLAIK
jgi:hypothetical protein